MMFRVPHTKFSSKIKSQTGNIFLKRWRLQWPIDLLGMDDGRIPKDACIVSFSQATDHPEGFSCA